MAFVASRSGRAELIAGEGERPGVAEHGAIAARVLDAGVTIAPHRNDDRTEAAAPVQYGGTIVGVLCARWAVGSIHDLSRASSILTTAAAAAAPVVSGALARRRAALPAPLTDLLGVTPSMTELRSAIERAAAAPFAVLITGRWPEGLRDFIVGVHRWAYRVQAYVFLLTDEYPPFQLD